MKRSTGLVVIGGSAGSLDAILQMLQGMKSSGLPPIVIVLHRKTGDDTTLTDLLSVKSPVRVKEAEEKEPILTDTIYIAPADYHLLIETDRTFSLDYSEKLNFSRPSIDITFQTAADAYGPALVGIVLSGANADGSDGLELIQQAGGMAVVQNPATADVSYMPQHALDRIGETAVVVNTRDLAAFVNGLQAG